MNGLSLMIKHPINKGKREDVWDVLATSQVYTNILGSINTCLGGISR